MRCTWDRGMRKGVKEGRVLVPLLFAVEMFLLGLRNEERRGKKIDGLDRALFFKHHVVSH